MHFGILPWRRKLIPADRVNPQHVGLFGYFGPPTSEASCISLSSKLTAAFPRPLSASRSSVGDTVQLLLRGSDGDASPLASRFARFDSASAPAACHTATAVMITHSSREQLLGQQDPTAMAAVCTQQDGRWCGRHVHTPASCGELLEGDTPAGVPCCSAASKSSSRGAEKALKMFHSARSTRMSSGGLPRTSRSYFGRE